MILGPYLSGKAAWERGDLDVAALFIDAACGGTPESPAVWLPSEVLEARAASSFENLLAGLLATLDHLLVPFDDAVASLWRAFPGQVVIHVLEQRAYAGTPETAVLDVIAADGMLSLDPEDHGRVGRVVLRPENAPTLFEHVDEARLRRQIEEASGAPPAERLAEVFLDAVFHRSRAFYPEMALDALTRIADREPDVLDRIAPALSGRDPDETEQIVLIGMRLEDGAPDCLEALVEAINSRSFERFAAECLLD